MRPNLWNKIWQINKIAYVRCLSKSGGSFDTFSVIAK